MKNQSTHLIDASSVVQSNTLFPLMKGKSIRRIAFSLLSFIAVFLLLFPGTILSQVVPELPLDFESGTVNYTFTDFDGGGSVKIANPQVSGINTSANVARMIKGAGQVWGGSLIALANPINFSVNKTFKVKVFMPRVGAKLLLKVENPTDPSINFEKEATGTVANAWEELTFDYSLIDVSKQFQKLVFIFDLGTVGDGSPNFTYLFDDINLVSGPPPPPADSTQMNLPVTFDIPYVNYGLVGFGGADASSIEPDPTLPTNKVAKVIKSAAAETWAGTSVTAVTSGVQTGFRTKIPFTASEKRMNVRVFSPDAGIKVRLKVEDHLDNTKCVETEATSTIANGWEVLTFNFATPAPGTAELNLAYNYNKASIFFNFGVAGSATGEKIYYFDDMKFGSEGPPPPQDSTQMNLPVSFDLPYVNYGLVGFGGAEASTIEVDPNSPPNKIAKVIKSATAELWAGTTVTAVTNGVQTGFASKIPFTESEKRMNVRVWSPDAGIKVRLKVEDYLDATKTVETEVMSSVANGWETLTFDFSNPASGTPAINLSYNYNKASIFFNFGVTGATAGEKTYYFDDMKFGSEGPPPSNLPVLPLDFESPTIDYTFADFDGGGTVKIANPQINGINTSANVARMIKSAGQIWGGSLIALARPINFSVNKTFKVKVFMPRAGAKLLLKVENQADPTISFEREVTGTVANAWEELTFDYNAIDVSKQYQKLVFIFDLGTAGDGSPNFTYLFDDVNLVSAPPPPPDSTQMNLPVTFDIPYVNYGLFGFGGADASTIEVDPNSPPNKIAKVIKSATAETWAGTTVTAVTNGVQTGFASKIPFTQSETKMNVRVWSPDAGIKVRLKVEDFMDPGKCVETEVTSTLANGWEVLVFDFTNQAPGTASLNLAYNYNKATIFFNFGVAGATAGEKTYYFDNMRFGNSTSVNESKEIPQNFILNQNFPNPFNPTTTISYSLPYESNVKLVVYNALGKVVKELVNEKVSAGYQEVNFGSTELSSGIYFYVLNANSLDGKQNYQSVKKMILLK